MQLYIGKRSAIRACVRTAPDVQVQPAGRGDAAMEASAWFEKYSGAGEVSLLCRATLVVLIRERCCELLKALSSSRGECCKIWFFYVLLRRRRCSLGPEEHAGKDAMGATGSLARAKLQLTSVGASPERYRSFSCKGEAKNRDEIRRDDRWEWKQK